MSYYLILFEDNTNSLFWNETCHKYRYYALSTCDIGMLKFSLPVNISQWLLFIFKQAVVPADGTPDVIWLDAQHVCNVIVMDIFTALFVIE